MYKSRTEVQQRSEAGRHVYVTVRQKFTISTLVSFLWLAVSFWLAQPWIRELTSVTGPFPGYLILILTALIPGFLNTHVLMSLLLDSPRQLPREIMSNPEAFPPISILIPAHNEDKNITETLNSIARQNYPAAVEIIVVDAASTDGTVSEVKEIDMANLTLLQVRRGGKAGALTEGLKSVTNEITVCMDAHTLLHRQALKRIVARLLSDPSNTAAVAGCVLVRNSRASWMTRFQEWDHFLGVSSAKRQQALYQGALVAQGTFSAFRTAVLKECQGWPAVVGEDIVLTWKLLSKSYRVGYEATALGFTTAPLRVRAFWRHRQRWARGMIGGLRSYGRLACKGNLAGFFVGVDFLSPAADFCYSLALLPGVILALAGSYYILGPMALMVMPVALLSAALMYYKQKRVFEELNLKVRRNRLGLAIFMLFSQPLTSTICLTGYFKGLASGRR